MASRNARAHSNDASVPPRTPQDLDSLLPRHVNGGAPSFDAGDDEDETSVYSDLLVQSPSSGDEEYHTPTDTDTYTSTASPAERTPKRQSPHWLAPPYTPSGHIIATGGQASFAGYQTAATNSKTDSIAKYANVSQYGSVGSQSGRSIDLYGEALHDPASYLKPANSNFHAIEFTSAACIRCSAPPTTTPSGSARLGFILVGLSLHFSWVVIMLTEAYWEPIAGRSVLAQICAAQGGAALASVTMASAWQQHINYRIALLLGCTYMVALCAYVQFSTTDADDDNSVSHTVLLLGVAGNGLATGLSSFATYNIAGLYSTSVQYSLLRRTSSVSLCGAAVVLLCVAGKNSHEVGGDSAWQRVAEDEVYALFGIAVLVCLCAMIGAFTTTTTAAFRASRLQQLELFVARDARVVMTKLYGRVAAVRWHLIGTSYAWAIFTFIISLSPKVPERGRLLLDNETFWVMQLSAVLVASSIVALVFGRALALDYGVGSRLVQSSIVTPLSLVLLIILTFCVGSVCEYVEHPYASASGQLFIVLLYAFMSAMVGCGTGVLHLAAQQRCGFGRDHLCPLVYTLEEAAMWLGVLFGGCCGLLPMPYASLDE